MSTRGKPQQSTISKDDGYIRKLLQAFSFSAAGLRAIYQGELAFRIELFLSIFVIPLAFFIGQTVTQQMLLLMSWFMVLLMEMVNTAIETTINRIGREQHPESGKAKDIGSALVFAASLQGIIIWGVIIFHCLF